MKSLCSVSASHPCGCLPPNTPTQNGKRWKRKRYASPVSAFNSLSPLNILNVEQRRYLANPPPRPVQRKSTQRSWRSSRGPNMLMGSSSTSHSPQRRRSVKPGLMEGSSQDTPPPSHQPLPEANQAPSTTLSHGRQPSQNGLHQGVPQMYHLPSSRLRTSQVHIRPSPQRKPTLTSVHTPLKEEEEGQEQMAIVGSSASPRTPNYITRPPLRSSSFASASNSSHKDDVSLTSRPSTGQSTSGLRASGDQSQATAATSVSSCSWLSDSDSEEAGQKHITHHPSEDEEEDMIDPAASQLGQLSLQQGRATATHESLLARKFSIERAARTRLARTPSKRVKYHSGKSVPERVLE